MLIENKIFCHQQQNLQHENNVHFEQRNKRLPSAKNKIFWEIFAMFNFSIIIVVLAAQVNCKIKSDIEFSGHRDQVTYQGIFVSCQQ